MTQIILDPTSASRLTAATGPVELCDPSGKVLGQFVPAFDRNEWEPFVPEVSAEELDRLEQSSQKRYTTAEVKKHLESL